MPVARNSPSPSLRRRTPMPRRGEAPFVERAADDGSGEPRRLDAAQVVEGGDASRRDDLDSPA